MTRSAAALLLALALAGCATPPPKRAAIPMVAAPAPPPTLVTPPAEVDWRDVPLTPGTWRYVPGAGGGRASYGPAGGPVFAMWCDLPSRRVMFVRANSAEALTLRTSSSTRTLPVQPGADGVAAASLAARDPLLDQLAFSRGRFSVASADGPTLFIPAWAEPARVIEDCRL